VRGRPQRVIPVTIAGGRADLGRTGGCAEDVRKASTMDGSNLTLIVMAIVIQICVCTAAAQALTAGRHFPGLPWDAGQPGRTKQRPDPDQASSDLGGSGIPAASAA
jgi:hypothetical protein